MKFTNTLDRALDLHGLGHRGGEDLKATSFRSQGACRTLVTLAYTNMIRILKVKKNIIRVTIALFPSSHPLIQQLNKEELRKSLLCARSTSIPTILHAVKYTKNPTEKSFQQELAQAKNKNRNIAVKGIWESFGPPRI